MIRHVFPNLKKVLDLFTNFSGGILLDFMRKTPHYGSSRNISSSPTEVLHCVTVSS